jgi:nicotinamidase-related amidase
MFPPELSYGAPNAIVVVDMQQFFLPKRQTPPGQWSQTLIKTQLKLLKWANSRHFHVLVFEYVGFQPTIAPVRAAVLQFGSDRFAFVKKGGDDGFTDMGPDQPDPEWILKSWGVQNIIITGINGSSCVLDTVRSALERDFNVFTAPELVANFNMAKLRYPDDSWWDQVEEKLHRFQTRACLKSLLNHRGFMRKNASDPF